MSTRYTADGKRKSSMTHAQRGWTCPCGRKVWGNGGKSSHQRACRIWAEKQLASLERLLADPRNPLNAPYLQTWAEERETLRERLGVR